MKTNYLFKRLSAVGLAFALVCATGVVGPDNIGAFANESENEFEEIFEGTHKEYKKCENNIEEQAELFESIGQDLSNAESIDVVDDELVYTFELDNGKNADVLINEDKQGDIEVNVVEEGIENNIVITADNRIFLDGNEVIVEESEKCVEEITASQSASWDTTKNPCSKKSWVYQYTSKDKDVRLGKAFKAIGGYALSVVLALALPVEAGIIYGAAVTLDGLGDIYSPNSKYVSYKTKVYYPKGGQYIGNNRYATKKVGTFYTEKNYEGESTQKTWYNIREYY